jgi:hypothetical protein
LTYLVPQPQAAARKADIDVRASAAPVRRSTQKRWPMALSIWAAVAVSLAMWAGIVWIISLFMGLFA